MKNNAEQSYVLDSFFNSIQNMEIFFQNFAVPFKVFYLKGSKDQIEENIQKFNKDSEKQQKQLKIYDEFL